MAVFYAVEFPLEDAKSRGPHIVPESKVNEENGSTRVLWKVVDENGAIEEAYFKATSLKKGTKKECGEFIDRLKKSRQKAEISNKSERSRKKPHKLTDYDFEDLTEQLTAKKPRPEVREFSLKNVSAEDLEIMESDSESFDPEADGKSVLADWNKRRVPRRRGKRRKLPTVLPAKAESHYHHKKIQVLRRRRENQGRKKTRKTKRKA